MKFKFSQKQAIIIIIALVCLFYFHSNFYQLIFLDDDTIAYHKFSEMSLYEKISSSFNSNFLSGHYYRPITSLTFILDSFFAERSFFIYHFTNFLVHLFTSIFLFLILLNLEYSLKISLTAALLFALNPIHINAVGWIAGRGDLLTALLTLVAFYIYIKFINSDRIKLLLLVSIFIFLSFLSKEMALLTPFMFLIFYFIEKKELLLNKKSAGVLLMVLITLGLYYIIRVTISSTVQMDKFSFTTYYRNILVLPETISKFFIPIGIKALPSTELLTSLTGIFIFIFLSIIPFKFNLINKYRYYFGFLWFIFLMIPGMVFRTMVQDGFYYWDCRSYLPLIGLSIMIAELVKLLFNKIHWRYFSFIIMFYILILGISTVFKLKIYQNPTIFWKSVKDDYPTRYLPNIGLYNYYFHIKDFTAAEEQLLLAIKKAPKDISLVYTLAKFYEMNDRREEAFKVLQNTLFQQTNGSEVLLGDYIILCIKMHRLNGIDELITLYSGENNFTTEIRKILLNERNKFIEKNDSINSFLILNKIRKLK